jgi:hypothetical protein
MSTLSFVQLERTLLTPLAELSTGQLKEYLGLERSHALTAAVVQKLNETRDHRVQVTTKSVLKMKAFLKQSRTKRKEAEDDARSVHSVKSIRSVKSVKSTKSNKVSKAGKSETLQAAHRSKIRESGVVVRATLPWDVQHGSRGQVQKPVSQTSRTPQATNRSPPQRPSKTSKGKSGNGRKVPPPSAAQMRRNA